MRYTKIELSKENMRFSAGHFTIFSATCRENFHGHNFRVKAEFILKITENGMAADYDQLKVFILNICERLNEHFILPAHSKHLKITQTAQNVHVIFNDESFCFLHRDVMLLPIENASLEEFSRYICDEFLRHPGIIETFGLRKVKIKTSSESGQWADYESTELS